MARVFLEQPPRWPCTVAQARRAAGWAVALVVALQALNSFGCYHQSLGGFVTSLGWVTVPMLPALVWLFSANPLRSVGASAGFAPWLPLAFYTDCVRPYAGGGASMIYVAVVLYGLGTALAGGLLAPWLLARLGVGLQRTPEGS